MDNNEIKIRKKELREEIQRLSEKIGNPTAYNLGNYHPYVNSPMFEEDKKKLEEDVTEYNLLVESFDVATLRMQKIIQLADGRFTLKYRPEYDRWDFYEGNEYMGSKVEFIDNDNIKVTIPTQNSDTHGEIVNYIYTIKIVPTVNATVAKLAEPKPCSKLEEGTATLNQDEAYFAKLGLVKDKTYNTYRRISPFEYDEQLKKQQKKPAKTKKDGKTLFGGKFHFKRQKL